MLEISFLPHLLFLIEMDRNIWVLYQRKKKNTQKKVYIMLKFLVQVGSGFWEPEWRESASLQSQTPSRRSLCLTLLLGWDQSWVLRPSEGNLSRLWEEREEVKRVEHAPRYCLSPFTLPEGKGCGGIAASAPGESPWQKHRNTICYGAEPGQAVACKD